MLLSLQTKEAEGEDYKHRRLVTLVERKQSLKNCSRELPLYHPTMAQLAKKIMVQVEEA